MMSHTWRKSRIACFCRAAVTRLSAELVTFLVSATSATSVMSMTSPRVSRSFFHPAEGGSRAGSVGADLEGHREEVVHVRPEVVRRQRDRAVASSCVADRPLHGVERHVHAGLVEV